MKYDEVLSLMQGNKMLVLNFISDGEIHRVNTEDNIHKKNGWYMLSTDGNEYWGALGIHSTGWKASIKISSGYKIDKSKSGEIKKKSQEINDKKIKESNEAAVIADKMWGKLKIQGTSDYVKDKKIVPYSARYGTQKTIAIPMYNENYEIRGLQVIYSEKNMWMKNSPNKRFWPKGCQKNGCFFHLPCESGRQSDVIFLCEGYATACTVRFVTRKDVYVAFDSGNLLLVSTILRGKFPNKKIVVCADDDWKNNNGNVGVLKSKEAAEKINGYLIIPEFPPQRKYEETDFNDIASNYGISEVERQFNDFMKGIKASC
jgi:putative DNA primase/helicase